MVDTETLDRLEREAAEAILSWAGERKLLTDDGHALLHTDGKPIALDVLDAIAVLRRNRDMSASTAQEPGRLP